MIDPFVALAPILVLPIVGLLRYIGCTLQTGGIPASVTVTVSPTEVTLSANGMQLFTATVVGAPQGVTWSLLMGDTDEPGIGTLVSPGPSSVTYQAPVNLSAQTAQVTIVATTNESQTVASGSASITLVDQG